MKPETYKYRPEDVDDLTKLGNKIERLHEIVTRSERSMQEINTIVGRLGEQLKTLYDELAGTELNSGKGKLWLIGQIQSEIEDQSRQREEFERKYQVDFQALKDQTKEDIQSIREKLNKYVYIVTGASMVLGALGKYLMDVIFPS